MDVLARMRAGGYKIECGVATTDEERAAVQAQRSRVCAYRAIVNAGINPS